MNDSVFILATCLDKKLAPATILVFRTLRIGFPDAPVVVWGNALSVDVEEQVREQCQTVKASFIPIQRTSHDVWIEKLAENSPKPFWVCDTDMVFFGKIPIPEQVSLLLGRYEPAFVEPWTGTNKVARLHTCLLWMNGPLIRHVIRDWFSRWHPKDFPFRPETHFIRQSFVPQGESNPPLFFDTCAGLYQAFGGSRFTEEQNKLFEHLHCGAYSNRIEKSLPGIGEVHRAVFGDLNAAKGLNEQQSAFYKDHAI